LSNLWLGKSPSPVMEVATFILDAVRLAAYGWFTAKMGLESVVIMQSDALHVMGGVLLQLISSAVLRRPISSIAPWVVVLVAELANELIDLKISIWPSLEARVVESATDLVLTMALPTILMWVTRKYPRLVRA
jgi:hypothetical protein